MYTLRGNFSAIKKFGNTNAKYGECPVSTMFHEGYLWRAIGGVLEKWGLDGILRGRFDLLSSFQSTSFLIIDGDLHLLYLSLSNKLNILDVRDQEIRISINNWKSFLVMAVYWRNHLYISGLTGITRFDKNGEVISRRLPQPNSYYVAAMVVWRDTLFAVHDYGVINILTEDLVSHDFIKLNDADVSRLSAGTYLYIGHNSGTLEGWNFGKVLIFSEHMGGAIDEIMEYAGELYIWSKDHVLRRTTVMGRVIQEFHFANWDLSMAICQDILTVSDYKWIHQWTEPQVWRPDRHKLFCSETRSYIKYCIVIYGNRRDTTGCQLHKLPRDIIFEICKFLPCWNEKCFTKYNDIDMSQPRKILKVAY